jgi:hypothetical protein
VAAFSRRRFGKDLHHRSEALLQPEQAKVERLMAAAFEGLRHIGGWIQPKDTKQAHTHRPGSTS